MYIGELESMNLVYQVYYMYLLLNENEVPETIPCKGIASIACASVYMSHKKCVRSLMWPLVLKVSLADRRHPSYVGFLGQVQSIWCKPDCYCLHHFGKRIINTAMSIVENNDGESLVIHWLIWVHYKLSLIFEDPKPWLCIGLPCKHPSWNRCGIYLIGHVEITWWNIPVGTWYCLNIV